MDEEPNLLEWLIDALAALLFAGAAAWTGWQLLAPPMAAVGSMAAFAFSFAFLRLCSGGGARFRLPRFEIVEWRPQAEPLELTDALPAVACPATDKVVHLFPAPPALPSAGELRERIERHLQQQGRTGEAQGAEVILLGADASAALRHAFGELKRSLG